MSIATPSEITKFDFGEGDIAFVVSLSTPPFGVSSFTSEDLTEDSRLLLEQLMKLWPELWPEILEMLQQRIGDYEIEQELGKDEFIGSVSRMDPDCFMGEESEVCVRLEFEEPPLWDFFLSGSKIVHFQPVF